MPARREEPELLGFEARAERHRAQGLPRREAPVDHAHERDDAAVLVVGRVEDERPRGRVRSPRRRRYPLDDRVEDVLDPDAGLRGDPQDVRRVVADQIRDLGRRPVRVGLRQVDLVHERDDLEVVLDRQVRVRERLRLRSLRGVDDEERAFARLQRTGDLVGEVDVARACR